MSDIDSCFLQLKPSQKKKQIHHYMHLPDFEQFVNAKIPAGLLPKGDVTDFIGFTKETQTIILNATLKHYSPKTAARLAGIPLKKLSLWLELGERGLQPFATFYREYERAIGEAEAADMDILTEQAKKPGGYKIIQWRLERNNPEEWAEKDTTVSAGGNQINLFNVFDTPLKEMRPEDRKQHMDAIIVNLSPEDKKNIINSIDD